MEKNENWNSLEILKMVSVLSMILMHALVGLASLGYIPKNYPFETSFLFGLFALIIPILASVMFRLRMEKISTKNYVDMIFYIKIFFIFYLINFIVFKISGLHRPFVWEVLPFIGLIFIIFSLLKGINKNLIIVIGIILFVFNDKLYNFLMPFKGSIVVDLLIGNFAREIYYPLLPWFFLCALGFFVGDLYLQFHKHKNYRKFLYVLFILGLLDFLKLLGSLESKIMHIEFVFPNTQATLFLVYIFVLSIILFEIIFSKIKIKKNSIVNIYSSGILWIYVFSLTFWKLFEPFMFNSKFFIPLFIVLSFVLSGSVGYIFLLSLNKKYKITFKRN